MLQPGVLFGKNSLRAVRVNNTVQMLLYNQRKKNKGQKYAHQTIVLHNNSIKILLP